MARHSYKFVSLPDHVNFPGAAKHTSDPDLFAGLAKNFGALPILESNGHNLELKRGSSSSLVAGARLLEQPSRWEQQPVLPSRRQRQ